MGSTYESLGINLTFDMKDLESQLGTIKSKLQNTFGDLSKLLDTSKMNGGLKATTDQIKLLQAAWKTDKAGVDKRLKEMFDIEQVQKYIKKDLDITKQGLTSKIAAEQKAAEEIGKINDKIHTKKIQNAEAQSKAMREFNAARDREDEVAATKAKNRINKLQEIQATRMTNQMSKDGQTFNNGQIIMSDSAIARQNEIQQRRDIEAYNKRATLRELEQKRDTELFNLKAAEAKRISEIQQRRDLETYQNRAKLQETERQSLYNRMAGTSGSSYKDISGGFVRSSVNTNNDVNTMAALRREAEKLNRAFSDSHNSSVKFKGGLVDLLGLEARFYGVRTALFALSSQMKTAISDVINLKQAVVDTLAISGGSLSEAGKMEAAALNIAKNSRFTATEVMKAMEILAQAGIKPQDLEAVTKQTVLFANATKATTEQSANLITTSMNVFDISAERSSRVTNALTATLNVSKLGAGGLATAFNYLANSAAQMNRPMEETLGIIAAMKQKGLADSTIGTGTSNLMFQFSAPKPNFKKLLDTKGISTEDINITKKSFADVIEVFEKAGVTTREITNSLERQTARALLTALNVGSQGFRTMTDAVTGTNAAFVANEKAMTGPVVKLNMLRQEFVAAVKNGEMFNGIISVVYEGLKNLTIGLASSQGKFLMVASSIGVLAIALRNIPALFTLIQAHPMMAAFTALGLILTTTLEGVGRQSRKLSEDFDKFYSASTKKTIELADSNTGLIDIMNQVNEKHKDSKIAQETEIKLKGEAKKKLFDLVKAYPDLIQKIKDETFAYGDLTEAIRRNNSERKRGGIGDAVEAQYQKQLLDSMVKEREERDKQISKTASGLKIPFTNTRSLSGVAYDAATGYELSKMDDAIKKQQELYNKIADKAEGSGFYDKAKNTINHSGLFEDTRENKDGGKPIPKVPKGKTAAEKAKESEEKGKYDVEQLKNKIEAFLTKSSEIEQEALAKEADADIKILEDSFNNKLITYEEKLTNFEDAKIKIAEKHDAIYEKKVIIRNKQLQEIPSPMINKEVLDAYENDIFNFAAERGDAKNKDILDATNKFTKATEKIPVDTSMREEKMEGMRLEKLMFELKVRKDLARTSEEVKSIELEEFAKQVKSAKVIEHIYQMRKNTLLESTKETKETEEWQMKLADADANLQAIQLKIEGINQQTADLASKGSLLKDVGYNFAKGWDAAARSMGTVESLSNSIGSKSFNGVVGGLDTSIGKMLGDYDKEAVASAHNSIRDLNSQVADYQTRISTINNHSIITETDKNNMADYTIKVSELNEKIKEQEGIIDKQKNAWSSLKDTIGSVLKDIAAEIRKFLISKAVSGLLQYLAGLGMSSASSTGTIMTSSTSAGTYTLGAPGMSPAKFADGGQVPLNLGTPGKDSVLAKLTPGEIVIKKSSVDFYGSDRLLALNDRNIPRFAEGGAVGRTTSSSSGSSDGQDIHISIVNIADPRDLAAMKPGEDEIMNIFSYSMAKNHPVVQQFVKRVKQG